MSSNKGPCMNCMKENPVFLHYLYHNNTAFQFCTSCVLASFPGAYCPICFQVFESEDFNSTPKPVKCSTCPALAHFSCVYNPSAASSSSPPADYLCPACSDPNFRYFNCQRDEETQTAHIDKHLSQELLAAAIISSRCMKEANNMWRMRVEILAQEAAEAHRRAKEALERLAELTMEPQEGQVEDDDNIVIIPSDEDGNEDDESEESSEHGEESNSEGYNSEDQIDYEENDSSEIHSEVTSGEDSNDEKSD